MSQDYLMPRIIIIIIYDDNDDVSVNKGLFVRWLFFPKINSEKLGVHAKHIIPCNQTRMILRSSTSLFGFSCFISLLFPVELNHQCLANL